MKIKYVDFYLFSATVIFFTTAWLKLNSLIAEVKYFDVTNIVFTMLLNKHIYLAAAGIEIIVGATMILMNSRLLRFAIMSWIALLFLTYKIFVWIAGGEDHCSCLGHANAILPFGSDFLNIVSNLILAYLLIPGGYVILVNIKNKINIKRNNHEYI